MSTRSFLFSEAGDFFDEEGTGGTAGGTKATQNDEENFVKRETKCISRLKVTVILALIIAMTVMATLAYRSIIAYESSQFQDRFQDDALSVIRTFYQEETNRIWTTALAAHMYQTYAQTMDLSLHVTTLPGSFAFDKLAFSAGSLSYALTFAYAPIVYNATQRRQFENLSTLIENDLTGFENDLNQPSMAFHGRSVEDGIYQLINNTTPVTAGGDGPYCPLWQIFPPVARREQLMYDQFSDDDRAPALQAMIDTRRYVTTKTLNTDVAALLSPHADGSPLSIFYMPVFDDDGSIGGTILVETNWGRAFENILQNERASILIVLENNCGEVFTFRVQGEEVDFLGPGDMHKSSFRDMEKMSDTVGFMEFWADQLTTARPPGYSNPLPSDEAVDRTVFAFGDPNKTVDGASCQYRIRLYPTQEFEDLFLSNRASLFTALVCVIFFLSAILFLVYDFLVQKRQTVVMDKAVRSSAIVNGLFPAMVQEKLFSRANNHNSFSMDASENGKLTSFLKGGMKVSNTDDQIAELFPETTILFADIAGFTAWSSEREPSQVFQLLESLYNEFDEIAMRLKVFKVETIGDCYVAVTGLPQANPHHAIVMARFASEMLMAMNKLKQELESVLGPGTSDLALRVGAHSGPVTAGVLRGNNTRFQLFGDTMNTASRMESTSTRGKIQVSPATAELVRASGKGHWLTPREGTVLAKGKGEMKTFWLKPCRRPRNEVRPDDSDSLAMEAMEASINFPGAMHFSTEHLKSALSMGSRTDVRFTRLVDWNVDEVLFPLVEVLAKRREALNARQHKSVRNLGVPNGRPQMKRQFSEYVSNAVPLDFARSWKRPSKVEVLFSADLVREQLRVFMGEISAMYFEDNAFHNFERACHVAQSAYKLAKRAKSYDGGLLDPLTQFIVVFASLVSGIVQPAEGKVTLDEQGTPTKRGTNDTDAAIRAIATLDHAKYQELRRAIYGDRETTARQLIADAVAVVTNNLGFRSDRLEVSAVAILKSAEVSHFMQHWQVFLKWNRRHFAELNAAYKSGQSTTDPSINWFEHQLDVFNHTVIPLATELKQCCGMSNQQCLFFAEENKNEWISKGKEAAEAATIAPTREYEE